MSLKRKRLDEILSTSIEDIENMFSWKIGARKAECLIRGSSKTKSTSINKEGEEKKRKLSSDANSCFSAQSSAPSTNSSNNVNSTPQTKVEPMSKKRQFAHPQIKTPVSQVLRMVLKSSRPIKFPLSIDVDESFYDDMASVPSIDMIDTLIQRGSSLH